MKAFPYKEKAAEIEEALQASAEASVKLDEQREVYRNFAWVGSRLYFIVETLRTICHMYQFSLSSFLNLFKAALTKGMEKCSTEERLERLCADLEVRVMYFVSRALFKTDRLMFAFNYQGHASGAFRNQGVGDIYRLSCSLRHRDRAARLPSWASNDRQAGYRLLLENVPHLVDSADLE